jgi:hypothetical protein
LGLSAQKNHHDNCKVSYTHNDQYAYSDSYPIHIVRSALWLRNAKKRCERLTTSPRGAVLLSPANFLLCWVTCTTPPPRLIEQLRVDSPRNGVYHAHPTQNEKRNNGKEKAANCKDNYETPLVEGRKSRTTSPFQGENASSEDRSDHEAICSGAAAARYEIRIETGASEIVGPPDRAVIEL